MNQLAFSTLGCPAWDIDQILSAATDYGCDAVELRGYLADMDLPLATPFTQSNRAETRQRFADAGVAICCVSSSGIAMKRNVDHVQAHCELARDLGAPRVRVFGGKTPDGLTYADGLAQAADALRAFGDAAQDNGVEIVLETHDDFSTGVRTAELLRAADHPAVFTLWDLHNPYRQNESPQATFDAIGPTVHYVHVKDGLPPLRYTFLGEGDVPIFPMLDLLLDAGYTGPISLEWEKRWVPELMEPEIAFPQYAHALRAYLNARG